MKNALALTLSLSLFTQNLFADEGDLVYQLTFGNKTMELVVQCDTAVLVTDQQFSEGLSSEVLSHPEIWKKNGGFQKRVDSIFQVNPVTLEEVLVVQIRDSLFNYCQLTSPDIDWRNIKTKAIRVDTLMQIDPVLLEEDIVYRQYDSMPVGFDFGFVTRNEIAERFEKGIFISNGSRQVLLKTVSVYYETNGTYGRAELSYPQPDKIELKKIKELMPGDLIILNALSVKMDELYDKTCYPGALITVK